MSAISPEFDFEMVYFNSDGFKGTMCGNGGRCTADFAIRSGIAGKKLRFMAADGIHDAVSEKELIRLKMNDVNEIRSVTGNYFINTGSPHYVVFRKRIWMTFDVFNEGRKIRWSKDFQPGGTNVNFVRM